MLINIPNLQSQMKTLRIFFTLITQDTATLNKYNNYMIINPLNGRGRLVKNIVLLRSRKTNSHIKIVKLQIIHTRH